MTIPCIPKNLRTRKRPFSHEEKDTKRYETDKEEKRQMEKGTYAAHANRKSWHGGECAVQEDVCRGWNRVGSARGRVQEEVVVNSKSGRTI